MAPPFDAVLFDLFDTLCHLDERIYREGKREAAHRLDLDPEEYLRAWLSFQDPCQRGEVAGVSERVRQSCRLLGREIDRETAEQIRALEEEVLLRCATLHPDVLPAIAWARSLPGVKLALVSNASSPARLLVKSLGLQPLFDICVFSFEVGSLKPEPEIYRAACSHLSVSPPRCLFVGDGNSQELEGAMALGMTAVRIERPGVLEPFRTNPSRRWNHSITDLRRLANLPWDRHSPAGSSVF